MKLQVVEKAIVHYTNKERRKHNLGKVRGNSQLIQAARNHAGWCASRNRMTHTGRNGSQPWERAHLAGYPSQGVFENMWEQHGDKSPQKTYFRSAFPPARTETRDQMHEIHPTPEINSDGPAEFRSSTKTNTSQHEPAAVNAQRQRRRKTAGAQGTGSVPLRPTSNTGANSLPRVRRETSSMAPAEFGKTTKGERHKTPPPVRRCRINRADSERNCRKRQRSKPHTQESAQQNVQSEGCTVSSAIACGAQITRPLINDN